MPRSARQSSSSPSCSSPWVITTLAAKRILAIAVIGIVAASFCLLISAAQLADYSDFADSELFDADVGAGLVVTVLGSLVALAGAIITCARRRRW